MKTFNSQLFISLIYLFVSIVRSQIPVPAPGSGSGPIDITTLGAKPDGDATQV